MTNYSITVCNDMDHRPVGGFMTGLAATLASAPVYLINTLSRWNRRSLERKNLADMDAHFLRDMGITSEDVRREINKPFWQA